MKRFLVLFVGVTFVSFVVFSAEEPKDIGINMTAMPLDQLLSLYQRMSGWQLIQSTQAREHLGNVTLRAKNLSKSEALRLIEKALVDQTRIVITRLDDKRVSVTFNDALPIIRPKD